MATRHDIYDDMAQWMIIHTREQKKYLDAYAKFRMLQDEYLTNPEFTFEGQDRNKAWLQDSRTGDTTTAMKDACASMNAAASTVKMLLIQLDPNHSMELRDAVQRLRDKSKRTDVNK